MGASASREKFRESVAALIDVDVSPDDAEFWDELWKIPSSTEEVFELISPEAARKLRDERFDNLATLFTQATAQLCQIVETPYSIYFDQALNCVRVLTRILPFLLEKGDLADSDVDVENLCWGTGGIGATLSEDEDARDTLVGRLIGGDEDIQTRLTGADDEGQEPLALLVVHAAMHMLFLPQFTCEFYEEGEDEVASRDSFDSGSSKGSRESVKEPVEDDLDSQEKRSQEIQAKEDHAMKSEIGLAKARIVENGVSLVPKPASIVWAEGCGVPKSKLNDGSNRKFDKNRIEVLRLIVAACCDPLFSLPDEYNPLASRWLAIAVAADAPNAVCLFYSLLNTIISFDPAQGYSSAFSGDTNMRLVSLSTQVLCILLDCGLSADPDPTKTEKDEPVVEFEEASKAGFNFFRTLLARIDSGRDLSKIFSGICRILRNVYEIEKSLIPKSSKNVQCHQETLVLLWKLLEENPLFLSHILNQCDVTEAVVPICYLMFEARKDPGQIGLVHICTFILLKLSGERSFGVALNKPFCTRLPCDIPLFNGGHADVICITLHKLIVNGAYKLVPLYSCFLTIICNISPYWRSMSLVASVKLVNLFELFSSPKFLYSGDKAHRHLALLIEVFNNVIQYQYSGNQHLIYAILRRKDSFGKLATLNLPKAISQCKKAYHDKSKPKKKANQPDGDAKKGGKDVVKTSSADTDGSATTEDEDSDSNAPSETSSVVGDHFIPSEEWLQELKETLPLETITRLLQHLVPVVDDVVNREEGIVDEAEILDVLREVTMVGLLPVPHAIVVRKYQPNQYTSLWFTTYLWGVIYMGNQSPPIFDGEAIQLFEVFVEKPKDTE